MSSRAENPSHACAIVVADELVRNGVTDAVLAPGSRSTALAFALHDDDRIRLHVEIDERSAGFLAVGLGRATGRPAPVVVTSGTAVANLHPAVVEADTGGVPLLLLTADRPPELRHTGANQAIDQLGIFGRAVRWHVELGVPEDRASSNPLWRSTVCRAVAESRGLSGPPGPVHVNLPFREPTVPTADDGRSPPERVFEHPLQGRAGGRPWIRVRRGDRRLDAEVVAGLAERVATARRGVIVVGAGEVPPEPVLALAAALGWPVLAEAVSGVRRGANAVAHAPLLLGHARFVAAHRPQLAVVLGRTGTSPELAAFLGADVPQLLVDADGRINDPGRLVTELVAADPAALCTSLCAQLTDVEPDAQWTESWRQADRVAGARVDAILDADDDVSEPRTARDLGASLPHGSTLVTASSMPVRDLDRFLAPRHGLRILANRGASGIDGFVSTTLGVALGSEGPVVGLTGDLSLLHDGNGFLLDADGRLDAVFIVVENDGGGIFSFLPQAGFPGAFERVFGTPHGRRAADLASLHHLGATAVERASELGPAVDDAIAAGGVHLVHLRTDRGQNRALHAEITAQVQAALDTLV